MRIEIDNDTYEENYKAMFFEMQEFISLHSQFINPQDLAFCICSSGAQIAFTYANNKDIASDLIKSAVKDGYILAKQKPTRQRFAVQEVNKRKL